MQKLIFIFTCMLLLTFKISAQNLQTMDVKVLTSPLSHTLTLVINVEKTASICDFTFKVLDKTGKLLKTVYLPDAGSKLETSVKIDDLPYGDYDFVVSRFNKELIRGQFCKDDYRL
ncbi:hypothetical protein CNR22_14665 [Sphingobacteriaceae bacterium]|nr:hypothetical protein CNR22_14665 [Sphingobacteriaceae bacterium]